MNGDPVIERVASIASTNAEIITRLSGDRPPVERFWLVADRQTGGRGRMGREWQDGAGNFMGSTVVHLRPDDPAPQTLALVAGLAVYDTVAEQMPDPRGLMLKWPNDVLFDGAKLAGILLERAGNAVVVGVGVNLSVAPALPDRKAATLKQVGVTVYRDFFAFNLANAMATALQIWREQGLPEIIARWTQRGPAPGTPLGADLGGEGRVDGGFAGLDDTGALLLRLEDGTMRAIHAGEVSLLGGDKGV